MWKRRFQMVDGYHCTPVCSGYITQHQWCIRYDFPNKLAACYLIQKSNYDNYVVSCKLVSANLKTTDKRRHTHTLIHEAPFVTSNRSQITTFFLSLTLHICNPPSVAMFSHKETIETEFEFGNSEIWVQKHVNITQHTDTSRKCVQSITVARINQPWVYLINYLYQLEYDLCKFDFVYWMVQIPMINRRRCIRFDCNWNELESTRCICMPIRKLFYKILHSGFKLRPLFRRITNASGLFRKYIINRLRSNYFHFSKCANLHTNLSTLCLRWNSTWKMAAAASKNKWQ